MSKCLECNQELTGRSDKKFCDTYCRSAYHSKNSNTNKNSLFFKIDKQLKTNRKILKYFNREGKSIVRKQALMDLKFNPRYFTNTIQSNNGHLYYFCYDFGYREVPLNGEICYEIVQFKYH